MQTRIPEEVAAALDVACPVVGARSRSELLRALAEVVLVEVRVAGDAAAAVDPDGLVARLRRVLWRRAEEEQRERIARLRGRLGAKALQEIDSADQVTAELRETKARRAAGGR